jgi:histidinol dehydrogenase
MKRISIIHYSKQAITKAADDIIKLATVEELTAHAESVKIRLK